MGLDSVELVMDVEDRFNITLPDVALGRVRTVADLAAIVISRLPRSSEVCPTASEFYRLRKVLVEHGALDRRAIRPGTRLRDLFPRGLRRPWRSLRRVERRLPSLEVPARLDTLLLWGTGTTMLIGVGAVALFWAKMGAYGGAAGLVLLLGLVVALVLLPARFASCLPAGVQTIGDLARLLAPEENCQGTLGDRLIAQQRVLDEVRAITAAQLGLPLEHVRPESEFVRDLDLS